MIRSTTEACVKKATIFIRPPHRVQRFAVLHEASESGQTRGSTSYTFWIKATFRRPS